MRVLLVNDYASPHGGAEVQMLALRAALRRLGHEALLFSSRADGSAAWSDRHCLGTTSRWRNVLQVANPWAARALRDVLAELRPDAVHVRLYLTQLSPLILPLLGRVPSLHHVVWYRPICPTGTKLWPDGGLCTERPGLACVRHRCLPAQDLLPLLGQLELARRWRHHLALVVANSEAVRSRLEREGYRDVLVVHNGVEQRPARPPLAGPPTAAFAGRLVFAKGADVLVEAFARVVGAVPEARLMIVGDGPERPRLAARVAALGLGGSVTLLPRCGGEDLERLLTPAWVQVVPSRWEEPFPNVALEAMSRGTAVVGTPLGGIPELVRNGTTGLLVEAGDVGALSAALLRLLGDREQAERMGAAARRLAEERFTMDACAERFAVLYARLASAASAGAEYRGVAGNGLGRW